MEASTRFGRPLSATVTCVVLSLSLPAPSLAQTGLAEITGTVRDSTGGAIVGASVTLTNTGTGFTNKLSANEVGLYYIRSISPGAYKMEVEAAGFKSYRATGIELATGQVLRYDVVMEVGQTVERIEVTAEAGAVEVQRDSGDVSTVINRQTIDDTPAITRKVLELAALTPGVNMTVRGNGGNYTAFMSIAGNPGDRSNIFHIDGTDGSSGRTQADGGNLPVTNPPREIVQEMRVITNNYSAEFGLGMGGVLLLTTRSGTNEFRGQAYYFGQNDVLDARNFFAQAKTPNRFHNAGGLFAGPVIKDKTHFLANFEYERQIQTAPQVLTIASMAQRQGDFSSTLDARGNRIPIYDPLTTRTDPQTGRPTRDLFPGNIIPSARFDPVAFKVLNEFVAVPNAAGTLTGANNFQARSVTNDLKRTWQFYRIDHQINSNNRLYGRFNRESASPLVFGPFVGTKGELADPFVTHVTNGGWVYSAGWTRILTPRTLSDFRVVFSNRWFDRTSNGLDSRIWLQNWAAKLGLKNLDPEAFPAFSLAGYTGIGSGLNSGVQLRIFHWQPALTFQEAISHQHGRHGMRAGVEWKYSQSVHQNKIWPSGLSNFTPLATAQPGVAGTGNSLASFLLGEVDTARVHSVPAPDHRTWFVGLFFQDDWRVSNSLTLNLGVRYEFDRPKIDVRESANFFNFAKINPLCNCPGVIEFGVNRFNITREHTRLYDSQPRNIAPRFGFAWTPLTRQDLVVRGGYGIFYTGVEYGDAFWDSPQLGSGRVGSWSSDGQGLTPAFRLAQGFPAVPVEALDDAFGAVPIGQLPRQDPRFYFANRPAGYAQQFNLGIQKAVGQNRLEVGYLGNAVKKIPTVLSFNEVRPEQRGLGSAQVRRPFPEFGNISGLGVAAGTSLYHALFIQVKRQYSSGLSFTTNYTFARQLDNISYRRSDYNRMADYGPSRLELRHRFVWGSVYELPWGPGKSLLKDGPLANILGGWSVGTIVTLQSRPPLSLSSVSNTCNCFTTGTQSVNVVGNPKKDTSSFDPNRDTWFNTAAFASPAQFSFGNAGAGILTVPGLVNVDSTFAKTVKFRERYALEIRGEFFNLFNHTNFNGPNTTFGSAAFGRVTSTLPGRISQVGVKLYF